jgi:glycosyltransferase involved in cell wall biosynthesis
LTERQHLGPAGGNESHEAEKPGKVLIAILAHNEERTLSEVIERARRALPGVDLIVINDGSTDGTREVLQSENVLSATHACNLGYGRSVQTALEYARRLDYDALVKLDADGQHAPEQLPELLAEFAAGRWDLLIGSRYLDDSRYTGVPLARRIGMLLFSSLVRLVTGTWIYDTTSGMKVFHRRIFEPLTQWHFVHFHAEAIVYLHLLGYRIGEHPISVVERAHGQSMYVPLSRMTYPLKTIILIVLGMFQAALTRRKKAV